MVPHPWDGWGAFLFPSPVFEKGSYPSNATAGKVPGVFLTGGVPLLSIISMKNIEEKTRELFAKNYPLAGNDGIFGPFTVGNVTLMSTLKGEALPDENQRIIYNICAVSD